MATNGQPGFFSNGGPLAQIIVEHNLQLMKAADWLIDLGPGAAEDGGRVVVTGTPKKVAACAESATGRVLAREFARDAALVRE